MKKRLNYKKAYEAMVKADADSQRLIREKEQRINELVNSVKEIANKPAEEPIEERRISLELIPWILTLTLIWGTFVQFVMLKHRNASLRDQANEVELQHDAIEGYQHRELLVTDIISNVKGMMERGRPAEAEQELDRASKLILQ